MPDVKTIINSSIEGVIKEEKSAMGVDVAEETKGAINKIKKIGPWLGKHLAGGEENALSKQIAINTKKAVDEAKEKMGVGEHLAGAVKKAVAAVKEKAGEAIKEHPGLAAATAAGLAAAVGGLAAVKKMRKAAAAKK